MATEQSSSESSTPQKRLRRAKHDPQFVFTTTSSAVPPAEPLAPVVKKAKPKPVHRTEENSTGADLYEPGDIVWSKLGSFPWWPALIYGSDAESGAHSRTLNSNGKSKRQFFVYFYGKYLEYSWLFPRSLVKYEGLERFIETAEAAVQKAATKSEQVELANRYQLKVSMKKRPQWDEAIALADQALTMTKAERIQEFKDLLDDAQSKKQPKKSKTTKESDMPVANKRPARMSSASSSSFDLPDGIANHNNSTADSVSPTVQQIEASSQHDGASVDKPAMSAALRHRIQSCIPPLSNYELKQIAESLLHHPDASTLTFDEAQRLAVEKAIEIVNENYQYRMSSVSAEWFFDAILLRYPSIVFKYRSWFETVSLEAMPNEADVVALKRWQIALMIRAQKESEERQAPPTDHA